METLEKNRISYHEMDKLIEFAEKVSANIETLKDGIKTKHAYILTYLSAIVIIIFLAVSRLFSYFLMTVFNDELMSQYISILLCSILTVSFYLLTFLKLKEVKDAKTIVAREGRVLDKLLNMIEGYKDLYFEDEYGNNPRVISKALFEMRLSRINFDVK